MTSNAPARGGQVPTRRRAAALAGTPSGTWNAEAAAGGLRGYPKTQEAFDRQVVQLRANRETARSRGALTRKGVPNGWRGRKAEISAMRTDSHARATRLCEVLHPLPLDAGGEDKRVVLCLTEIAAIALCPSYRIGDRITAGNLFLTYTLPRPSRRITQRGGLDTLALLAALADQCEGSREA